MEFGLFHEFHHPKGYSPAAAFEESFAQVDAAEQYGFDAVWLAESHFSPERSVLAAPLVVASAIAARTRRLKVGLAILVLPLGNPLHTAEEAATVDHVSRGRFELGIGRSSFPTTYERFGIPYDESRGRMFEQIDIIRQAWTQEQFSYHGTYYAYDNVNVTPKPYQKPHPPMRLAVTSPDTYPEAGCLGLPIFVAVRLGSLPGLVEPLRQYRAAWKEAGHPGEGSVVLRLPVFVAETVEQALRIPQESTMGFYRYIGERLTESASHAGTRAIEGRIPRGQRLQTITYAEAQQDKLAYGTPEMVLDRLAQLGEELGLSAILTEMNCGQQIPHQHVLSSMRLFADKVIPALR